MLGRFSVTVVLALALLGAVPACGGGDGGGGGGSRGLASSGGGSSSGATAAPGSIGGAPTSGGTSSGGGASGSGTSSSVALTDPLLLWTDLNTGDLGAVDIATGAIVASPGPGRPGSELIAVALSADGRLLLVNAVAQSGDPEALLYDRQAQQEVPLPGMVAPVWASDMTPDGRFILAATRAPGGYGGSIVPVLYDRTHPGWVPLPGIRTTDEVPRLSADGMRIAYVEAGSVQVYDRAVGGVIFDSASALGLWGERPRITASGRHAYFSDYDDVVLYDLDRSARLSLPGISFPGSVQILVEAMSPDGRYLAVTGLGQGGPFGPDSEVALYDASSAVLAYLPLPGIGDTVCAYGNGYSGLGGVAVSADGRHLAGAWLDASSNLVIHLYDRQAGALVPLPSAASSPDAEFPLLWP